MDYSYYWKTTDVYTDSISVSDVQVLNDDILLGAAGWMFVVQDAWVDGFCISQMDPESGTDMERVTGGKRLCCCSGDLYKQNMWNVERKYDILEDKLMFKL